MTTPLYEHRVGAARARHVQCRRRQPVSGLSAGGSVMTTQRRQSVQCTSRTFFPSRTITGPSIRFPSHLRHAASMSSCMTISQINSAFSSE